MNLNLNIYGLEDLGNRLNLYKKEAGFDFLFIPLQLNTDIKVYNLILEKLFHQENFFNDSKIIKEVNNNIDILYCIFANFHFSRYHISAYFSSPEHNNIKKYFSKVKGEILRGDELIVNLFIYFFDLETYHIYKNFNYFTYEQLLSLLISARFIINNVSSKNKNSILYNLLVKPGETINNNKKLFNEYYLKVFDEKIKDNRNINCLTYKLINYIILSYIYFGFKLKLIKFNDMKNINLLKELKDRKDNNISDYLLDNIFKEFNFIKKNLLPLLGINNVILFMNLLFKEIHKKLDNFNIGDSDDKIKMNEQSINSLVNNVINNYSKTVDEYYEIEDRFNKDKENDLIDIITEKPKFYNDKEYLNKKYPLLPYLTYTNYSALNNDFQNQFLYFNNNSSNYPLISSILYDDDIFDIVNFLPVLNKFSNCIYNSLNMRYTKEEINTKTIKEIFKDKFRNELTYYNNFIQKNDKLFDKRKLIEANTKIFEIINMPGSIMNSVYNKIIEKYNMFISKMKILNDYIFDNVVIQEARENDYNFNYVLINDNKLTIKEKLDELILLYSKRERKINNKINVYNGGKIIYNFEIIEDKLEEQFILGKKIFSENQKKFIFSSEIFDKELNIIQDFQKIYPTENISEDNKNKIEKYLRIKNEEFALNLFYELYTMFSYIAQNAPNIKFKNVKDLIKYLELKQYEFIALNDAIKSLRSSLLLNNILYFYEIVENEAFINLTKNIQMKIRYNGIFMEENIINNIEKSLNENKIIKIDNIISAMKKYILRNIRGKDEENYLFNFNNLNQKELWNPAIFDSMEFNEEFKKLDLNENNVVNYLYSKIYNLDIRDVNEENEIIDDPLSLSRVSAFD